MQEYEYVNTGNLARLRTAMRIMQECVFLDETENKKCQSVLHDICGLEFHTNNKIKIAPQNLVEAKRPLRPTRKGTKCPLDKWK